MKALSLWNPWASLMAIGAKRIETRHWQTDYRGLVALHAAKTTQAMTLCGEEPFTTALTEAGYRPWCRYTDENIAAGKALPMGYIVAVGELVDCVRTDGMYHDNDHRLAKVMTSIEEDFGDYSPGRFGWLFRNVRRLATPIPYRGQQGLWTLEPAIVEQINQEVSAHV